MAQTEIVRVVVDGWTWHTGQKDNVPDARRMLATALRHNDWPRRANFAMTPGGFIRIPLRLRDIRSGWGSETYFERLLAPAREAVSRLLAGGVKERLGRRVRYFTVGVDLNNTSDKYSSKTHAELVALVDTKSGNVHWTGKSYPTTSHKHDQSRTLVQAPIDSHCFCAGGQGVLILGCHDLHMFGGRGRQSRSGRTPKEAQRQRMLDCAAKLQPRVVLHHPHTTYSPRIWSAAWGHLRGLLPTMTTYASGVSFCGKPNDRRQWNCNQTLKRTLPATKFGAVADVVVQGFPCKVEEKWKEWAASNC